VNSNFTFTKLKKLIFANKVNYKSFNYVGTIKRVAVYIFHFQFCNNRLFQGDDVTALTDDITYINRSLISIHVNSTLEPNGLSRDDGKRPDGMTLVPWIKGQPLVWDVTVVDTLADSYVLKTSEVSGCAAKMACKRKHSKYSSIISSNYIFKGLLAFRPLVQRNNRFH
jgi:hypothetical protein